MKLTSYGRMALLAMPLNSKTLSIAKGVPVATRWQGTSLIFDPTPAALAYLEEKVPDLAWPPEFRSILEGARFQEMAAAATIRAQSSVFPFKTKPFQHQLRVFETSRDAKVYALLMEQGTGKTKVIIDTAAWLFLKNEIDMVMVVAPNGVHRNWVDNELPIHMSEAVPYKAGYWLAPSNANRAQKEQWAAAVGYTDGLSILTVNVEAFSHKHTAKVFEGLLKRRRVLLIVDESTRIKQHDANRTKAVMRLRALSLYRRIMTGTPVTQGPLDLFGQFEFLEEGLLGFDSFAGFRKTYAIMAPVAGGNVTYKKWRYDPDLGKRVSEDAKVETVIGYQHVDDLQRRIEPHSFRVLKSECLDLPPKLYKRMAVDLSPEQRRLYNEFKEELMAEIQGQIVAAPLAITKLLRFRQVVGGFVNDYAIEDNPRLDLLKTITEDLPGKALIWACFKGELRALAAALRKQHGDAAVVEYHGEVSGSRRAEAVRRMQEDPACRFFVGHPVAAGIGLTLTRASTTIYYQNDFSLETRLQSEDRNHRIGQTDPVTYIDLYAAGTVDQRVVEALRSKRDLANQITGDELLSWI